uniref:DNA (cytosine-5-)-methyltransferase n=1 Tax=viral metagenome TaxID=1070528 RepID=A0A6C0LX68_9ZZZZ
MNTCIKVGTDCSGIEAPIQALKQLGIQYNHVFSSEIDKYAVQSIKANYHPKTIFGDITNRNNDDLEDIDLYVAGFPCQPFSTAGVRKGFDDKKGNIFWSCVDVIKKKRPKWFILENVKGLLHHDKKKKSDKNGRTWNVIWETLKLLNKDGYTVKWKLLNTKDYGVPQSRERVFIVGKLNGDFDWPPESPMDNIINYVDHTNKIRKEWGRRNTLDNVRSDAVFIDIEFLHYTNFPNSHKVSPCLLARPCSLWCVPYHRYATCKEHLDLQGFKDFKQVVSNSQMKKQAGNSMSVNVVSAILNEIL